MLDVRKESVTALFVVSFSYQLELLKMRVARYIWQIVAPHIAAIASSFYWRKFFCISFDRR